MNLSGSFTSIGCISCALCLGNSISFISIEILSEKLLQSHPPMCWSCIWKLPHMLHEVMRMYSGPSRLRVPQFLCALYLLSLLPCVQECVMITFSSPSTEGFLPFFSSVQKCHFSQQELSFGSPNTIADMSIFQC